MMKLNDICEVYSGYALKEFNNDSNGFPVIKIGNIIVDGSLALDDCQFTTETVNEKYHSQYGDIYVALSGATTGKIGIMQTQKKHIINQRVGIVRKKADDIPNAFIKYFLMYQTDRILQEASGCAQPNISPKQIALYEIPEFEPKEISKIVEALDNVTDIIKMRQQQLAKLDELVKARFVELLNDSEKEVRLDDLISPYKAEKCGNNTYPVLSITMRNGLMLQSDRFKKEIASGDKSQYKVVPRNKLVVAFPIDEGLLSAQTIVDAGIVSPAYNLYSIDESKVMPKVLEYILRSDKSIQYYLSKLRGTTLRRRMIPKEDFYSMPIQLPTIDRQKQFLSEVNQVDKSKVAVQKALDEAQTLFDSLMQQYFG